jgi:hypothetical protein
MIMNIKKRRNHLWLFLVSVFIFAFSVPAFGENVNKITKEELKKIMDTDTVSIVDVRQGRDWSSSEFKIKGAVRGDTKDIVKSAKKYPKNQTLVLYCA